MNDIIAIINSKVNGQLNIKLKKCLLNLKNNSMSIDFYVDAILDAEKQKEIFIIVRNAVPKYIENININYISFNYSSAGVTSFLNGFFMEFYPKFAFRLSSENTFVDEKDGTFFVKICCPNVFEQYVNGLGFLTEVQGKLKEIYDRNFEISFDFSVDKDWEERIENEKMSLKNKGEFVVQTENSYSVINVKAVVGQAIHQPATIISDIFYDNTNWVFGGIITKIEECLSKEKKTYFKFGVKDVTGSIDCMIFPREYKVQKENVPTNAEKFRELKVNDQVICKGTVKRDSRTNSFLGFVSSISLCDMPSDSVVKKKIGKKAIDKYMHVFPEKYVLSEQVNILDTKQDEEINPSLIGKTFVVFDIETTGLNPTEDTITEIGALKIEDGKITETFSTLINPERPLSEEIIRLTNITDSMLKNAPTIDKVIPDFYKFCVGSVLVGHNAIGFDMKFILNEGEKLGYFFLNKVEDTMLLARKQLEGLKNVKLGTVAEYFGVGDFTAHRALGDAEATAHIFMKLY